MAVARSACEDQADMHQLLLLRHAKSDPGDLTQVDHARALNQQGRQQASTMRHAMRELGLAPDIVLVSSAVRALETAAGMEPWAGTPLIEVLESLHLAPVARLLGVLQNVAETAYSVLVIAHNPGLHELAIALAGEQAILGEDQPSRALTEGFPTAALAEFLVPGSWQELEFGRARLLRLLRPRDIMPAEKLPDPPRP